MPSIPKLISVEVGEEGPLTSGESVHRAAFTQFCWDLTLARGRRPRDTGLSPEDAARIRGVMRMSDDDLRAKGEQLWADWEATGKHTGATAAPFTKDAMLGLIVQIGNLKAPARTAEEMHRRFQTAIASEATS